LLSLGMYKLGNSEVIAFIFPFFVGLNLYRDELKWLILRLG